MTLQLPAITHEVIKYSHTDLHAYICWTFTWHDFHMSLHNASLFFPLCIFTLNMKVSLYNQGYFQRKESHWCTYMCAFYFITSILHRAWINTYNVKEFQFSELSIMQIYSDCIPLRSMSMTWWQINSVVLITSIVLQKFQRSVWVRRKKAAGISGQRCHQRELHINFIPNWSLTQICGRKWQAG